MTENQELVGGRYRVLGKLGKGAMGVVFVAHDPVLDRKVAIKQMTAEIAQNEDLRQRFYVEARAAARLNHPHIITIHELQESGGEIYMVMEMLEGQPLSSLIEARPGPLPLETTLDVMAQVCDGLDYAHGHAIIHRDIKPANLFLTSSGVVKILDFGIARLGSLHMTATGALVGTPDYMSPEQVRGDEIDRRTDLWAVGAVLYQLLSGTKPFDGRPLAKLLMAITQNAHVPLQQRAPALPKTVCDLVDRLLSKPRDQRPATAALVRDELRAILGRESVIKPKVEVSEAFEETLVIGSRSAIAAPPSPPLPPAAPAPVAAPAPLPVPVAHAAPVAAPVALPPPVPSPAAAPPAAMAAPMAAAPKTTPPPPAVASTAAPAPPVAPSQRVPPASADAARPAAAGAPAAAAPRARSRVSLAVTLAVVVALLALAGGGAAAWWFFGPRLLEMAGLSTPSQPTAATQPVPAAAEAPVGAAPATNPTEAAALPSVSSGVPADSVPPANPATAEAAAAPSAQPTEPAEPPRSPGIAEKPASHDATPHAVPSREAVPPASHPAGRQAATSEPAPERAAARPKPAAAPSESKTTEPAEGGSRRPAPRVTEKLTGDTVATLSGRSQSSIDGVTQSGATVAAVNRINWVLEQYAAALQRRDADGVRQYRPSLSGIESQLLGARSVSFRLETVNVQVDGTSATARCRRLVDATLASGAPLREQGSVTVALTRRATGWVITDVR